MSARKRYLKRGIGRFRERERERAWRDRRGKADRSDLKREKKLFSHEDIVNEAAERSIRV